jgi:cellobiose phosphorylase
MMEVTRYALTGTLPLAICRRGRRPLLSITAWVGYAGRPRYVISLHGGERPPAPWVNVLANPDFVCVVTEAGGGYTWAGNSQMNRLTPWSNDPVTDPPGEAVYLRDEETGEFWSPTPAPCGSQGTMVVRHGQGYSRFTCTSFGLEQDLTVLVSPEAPVKLFHLHITNPGNRPRRLSAAFYAEWVVGIQRDRAPLQVVCAADSESDALFATNAGLAVRRPGRLADVAAGHDRSPAIVRVHRSRADDGESGSNVTETAVRPFG